MTQQVLIIGAGEIGKALSAVLSRKENLKIKFWDDRARLSSGRDLDSLVKDSQFIFICVPSSAISEVVSKIKPALRWNTLVISLTKGVEKTSGKFSNEILRRRFGRRRTAILAGPMIAEELKTGAPTKVTVGGTKASFQKLSGLLAGTSLYAEYSPDSQGVAVAGVLKNIYAMGLGMIDALGFGSNAKGVFINVALLEMGLLIKRLGGKSETVYMLAGLGDLEATGNSTYSTNRIIGRRIIEGKLGKSTGEGLVSLEPLIRRLGNKNLPSALLTVRRTIKNPKNARKFFEELIKNA
jgi:glycerol-3-phosphate dehydrogenase (NAD(P)+)